MASGQWYIISAAFVAAGLFAISILFRGYFVSNPVDVIKFSEDYYFKDVKYCLSSVPDNRLAEFELFAETEMRRMGFFSDIAANRSVEIRTPNMVIKG
ncbi:MAG: hypothetical protein HZB66_03585 [Candidatus Aenigmarchaeota archaeon]|nr:hypothetical protein [Candidatus Aenigmarchaeota archaeon]